MDERVISVAPRLPTSGDKNSFKCLLLKFDFFFLSANLFILITWRSLFVVSGVSDGYFDF